MPETFEIRVERNYFSGLSSIGRAFFNGLFEYFTLEPPVRPDGVKIDGRTAIPCGRYRAVIRWSPRHAYNVIGLLGVPGFSDVEWHIGNFPHDTKACTLPGVNMAPDAVLGSEKAFKPIMDRVAAEIASGKEVWITYENLPVAGSSLMPPVREEATS